MKIIRPIELAGGIIESNAPADIFSAWAPVGRDFLSGRNFIDVSEGNGTAYFVESGTSNGDIVSADLDTGGLSVLASGVSSIYDISISPDGLYMAVCSGS